MARETRIQTAILLFLAIFINIAPTWAQQSQTATTENFADYSGLSHEAPGTRFAGSFWGGGQVATHGMQRWWGSATSWPPQQSELFSVTGGWLLNVGFKDDSAGVTWLLKPRKTFLATPAGLQDITTPDGEPYALWNIPQYIYVVETWGDIIRGPNGAVVGWFNHKQTWYPPEMIFNPAIGEERLAVRQDEYWEDSAGTKISRSVWHAKGVGPIWRLDQDGTTQTWMTAAWQW